MNLKEILLVSGKSGLFKLVSKGNNNIIVESWNPDKQEELTVEATDKMKKEISRERQIMENAMKIFNRKPQTIKPINEGEECGKNGCTKGGDPFHLPVDKEMAKRNSYQGFRYQKKD